MSLILTRKILGWSEDLTSYLNERTFLWALESESLTLFKETEIG